MNLFSTKENELRTFWKVLSFLGLVFLLSLPFLFVLSALPEPYNIAPFGLALALPLATWIMVKAFEKKSMQFMGMPKIGFSLLIKEVGLGIFAGAIAMIGVAAILSYFSKASFSINPTIDYTKVLGYFVLMLCVGFYEELQVRGYLLRVLSDGFRFGKLSVEQGFWVAVAFTSVLFGVLHIGNPNASIISTINISIAGLLLAYPIAVTGRIYGAIGLHFSWNWFQGGLFGMPVSGTTIENSLLNYTLSNAETMFSHSVFTGGKFGPEAGIVGIVGMGLAALPFWFLYKKQNRNLRIFAEQFNQLDK